MQILNLGCGAVRPNPPFVNFDSLCQLLPSGTVERDQLNAESNYVEGDLRNPLPFASDYFDGILASHVLEHFDAISGTALLRECHRVLKTGGSLMVSVPDASYHRKVYAQDCKKNCLKLFGETIPESEPKQTFLEYALCFSDHRMVYAEDSLWAILVNSGFANNHVRKDTGHLNNAQEATMHTQLNRQMFSLVIIATK